MDTTTPIQSVTPPTPTPPDHPGRKFGGRNMKMLGVIAALVVIIVAIPITIFLSRQEQDIRQEASVGANFSITCQPEQTVNLNGSREIRAVVRNKNTNQLIDGRTVLWSITNNPGNWIANVTTSSKTSKGIATAIVRSNPAVISNSQGTITARVNGDTAALCRITLRNAQTAPPAQLTPTPQSSATPSPSDTPTPSTELSITPKVSPSSTPTVTPSVTPSITPSAQPSTTPIPSDEPLPSPTDTQLTPPSGSLTTLHFSVLLHGIGISGDSVLPRPEPCQRNSFNISECFSNQNPQRPVRTLSVQVFNQQNQLIETVTGDITYNEDLGYFTGNVSLGDAWVTGPYLILVRTPMNLARQIQGIHTIQAGSDYTIPAFDLRAGDVNNNNQLEILDYNMIVECITDPDQASKCDPEMIAARDINDDGIVDLSDSNLFIRELSVQYGN